MRVYFLFTFKVSFFNSTDYRTYRKIDIDVTYGHYLNITPLFTSSDIQLVQVQEHGQVGLSLILCQTYDKGFFF